MKIGMIRHGITDWNKEVGRRKDLVLDIEEHNSVILRGNDFFDEIIRKHRNEKVLIVSHGAFIKKILKELVPDLNEKQSL